MRSQTRGTQTKKGIYLEKPGFPIKYPRTSGYLEQGVLLHGQTRQGAMHFRIVTNSSSVMASMLATRSSLGSIAEPNKKNGAIGCISRLLSAPPLKV